MGFFDNLKIITTRNGSGSVTGYREDLAPGDIISAALSSYRGVTSVDWFIVGRPAWSSAGGAGPEPIFLATAQSASFTVDSDTGGVRRDGTYILLARINAGAPNETEVTVALARSSGLTIPTPTGFMNLRKMGGFESMEDTSIPAIEQGWKTQLDGWLELLRQLALGGSASTTLAQAYAHGAFSGDQTLTVLDAKGGGVVVDGSQGGFTGANALAVQTAGASVVIARSTGNLGIGTTTPLQPLHISGAAPAVRFQRTGGASLDVANVGDELQFLNGATVLGKFEPTGGLRADLGVGIGTAPATNPVLSLGNGAGVAVSALGTARFRYNGSTGHAEWSENGGAWQPFAAPFSAYQTIDVAGTPLTQRSALNVAAPLTAVDNAGASRTDLSLNFDAASLVLTGGTTLARAALTGDVTAAQGGNVTTIATNAVTNTKFRQSAGLSVVGNSTNALANVADITATATGQVLQDLGTTLGFAALAYSSLTGTPTLFYQTVAAAGTALTQRPTLNFTAAFTPTDNLGSTRTDVDLANVGPGAGLIGGNGLASITLDAKGRVTAVVAGSFGYQTIDNAGTPLTQRAVLNVFGGLVAADNSGASRTDLSVATNGISNTMIRQSAGLSLIGNPTGTAANVQDVTVGSGLAFIGTTIVTTTVADWPVTGQRWFAADATNGNDANVGYSDVSEADAGTKAVKTLARLFEIIPKSGAGRSAKVVIAQGTYADGLPLNGLFGYNIFGVIGTATNSTAGAVAFDGSANTDIGAGAITVPGLNPSGYNPTGTSTASTWTMQQVGGGAAGLPTEPAAPLGWRVRFDVNTATVALRNIAKLVSQVNSSSQITVTSPLPATPTTSDVFYLEKAGVIVGPTTINSSQMLFLVIGGIDMSNGGGGLTIINGIPTLAFCGTTTLNAQSPGGLQTIQIWQGNFPSGSRRLGGGLVVTGNTNNAASGSARWASVVGITHLGTVEILDPLGTFVIGQGSTYAQGIVLHGSAMAVQNPDGIDAFGTTTTDGIPRIIGPGGYIGGTANLMLRGTNISLRYVDLTGAGAHPAILASGQNNVVFVGVVSGSTGNSDVGLDLTAAYNSRFMIVSTPTVTGTAGDVRLSDGTIITWAQAMSGVMDPAGNSIVASGHPFPIQRKPNLGTILTDLAAGGVVHAAASTGVLSAGPLVTADISSGAITTTTIATNAVTYAKIQQVAGLSVIGNPTGTLANASAITATTNGQVLQVSGGALTWAALAYSSLTGTPTLFYQTVATAGTALAQRPTLNFTARFTAVDNSGSARTDVDLAGSGVSAGSYTSANITVDAFGRITSATNGGGVAFYQTIENGGTPLPQRGAWNASTGLTAADNGGAGRTDITVNLSTGLSGGQAVFGGTAAGEALHLVSTVNATKGRVYLGAGTADFYDEPSGGVSLGSTLAAGGIVKAQGTTGRLVIAVPGVDYQPATTIFYQTVQAAGSALPQRLALNLSSLFSTTDNSGSGRTDVTLAATGVTPGLWIFGNATFTVNATGQLTSVTNGSFYTDVAINGTLMPERSTLNFSTNFKATDSAAPPRTTIDLANQVGINGVSLPNNAAFVVGHTTNANFDRVQFFVGGGALQDSPDSTLFLVSPTTTSIGGGTWGVLATQRITAATWTSSAAPTVTEGVSLYIDGPPAMTGSILANAYSLHVASGQVRLDGTLRLTALAGPAALAVDAFGNVVAQTIPNGYFKWSQAYSASAGLTENAKTIVVPGDSGAILTSANAYITTGGSVSGVISSAWGTASSVGTFYRLNHAATKGTFDVLVTYVNAVSLSGLDNIATLEFTLWVTTDLSNSTLYVPLATLSRTIPSSPTTGTASTFTLSTTYSLPTQAGPLYIFVAVRRVDTNGDTMVNPTIFTAMASYT